MVEKKILVIDDEPDICRLIKAFLDRKGFQTWTATDADQGLLIFQREHPTLVLLDVKMPRVSGLECLERIKKKNPETIVVILSGMQDEETAREAIIRGAYDYITKPFDRNRFEEQILSRIFPA